MRKWIDNNIRIVLLCAAVVYTTVFFFAGHRLNFATDTFATFDSGYANTTLHMALDNGRLVTAGLYMLFAMTGAAADVTFYILYWGGMITLCVAIYILAELLYRHIGYWSLLIAPMLLINVFIIDYFLFLEAFGFCSGILFTVIAVKLFADRMDGGSVKDIAWSTVFLCLAQLCYQAVPGAFVGILLPFFIYYSKGSIRTLIRFNVEACIEYVFVNAASFFMMAFAFHSDRVELMGETFGESLKIALTGMIDIMKDTDGILDVVMPAHVWCVIVIVLGLLACVRAVLTARHDESGSVLLNLAYVIYIFVIIMLLQFVLYVIGRAVARVSYPLGVLPGAVALHMLLGDGTVSDSKSGTFFERIIGYIACACGVVLLLMELVSFTIIFGQRYEGNRLDRDEIVSIGHIIDEYEQNTGIQVNGVVFYYDENSSDYWDCITYYSDTSVRSLRRIWSHYTSVNYYLGRNFYILDQDPEIKQMFESQDWNEFDEDQVMIVGDVAHICVY